MIMSENVAEEGVVDKFIGEHHHDDRIDVETEISSRESFVLLVRCLKLLYAVRWLFTAKFLLRLCAFLPGLLLPWLAKIVIDNVLLQKSFSENENPYPPFMHPIINFLDGMTPLEIMFTITAGYFIGLIFIGARTGGGLYVGTYGNTLTGQDEASAAENKISNGYTESGGILGVIEYWVTVRLSQRLVDNVRTRLFARLTRLPMAVLSEKRTGDSIYRVLYDTSNIPLAVTDSTFHIFYTLLGSFISMYLIGYSYSVSAEEIVWIAWSVLPLVFILTFPAAKLMRRINQTKRSAGSATTNAMEETVDNIDAVQSLGGMQQETEKFAMRSLESYFRERVSLLVGGALFIGAGIAVLSVCGIVFVMVTNSIIKGDMSAGDFGVIFIIFWGIAGGAIELGGFWLAIQNKMAPARRIFFFIDYESDDDHSGGDQLVTIARGVEVYHVDYDYPDGRRALTDITLDLPVGQTVALVGPSGAGKTSLAYLVPGFLKPTHGHVRIDGKDVSDLDIDSVRSYIAYVFQEHLLLAESIRDNLRLAKPQATDEEIEEALIMAGCMSFIDEMPDGIDTVLGRSGSTLSVGQQQRLCIARGLIRDAKILILDEPTAALDPESENLLFESLEQIARDRLLIVVAHRLSTIQRADKIVFLEDGKIREQGTHTELMNTADGHYRRYVGIIESDD